ncbi:hypothetical protein DCS_07792 [Drechmeria coniospora]|uniref:Uncharacterized protein n=1 Tax=Drechmeria coniospora TaxID=98403 RepID=A0A151GFG2_DRECN|nr:hypothetical protein DCS_07792 [Drechmeria coniospora]KYK55828.1 hypothetical protein DCS_07792 [Drechmeria coniospora]
MVETVPLSVANPLKLDHGAQQNPDSGSESNLEYLMSSFTFEGAKPHDIQAGTLLDTFFSLVQREESLEKGPVGDDAESLAPIPKSAEDNPPGNKRNNQLRPEAASFTPNMAGISCDQKLATGTSQKSDQQALTLCPHGCGRSSTAEAPVDSIGPVALVDVGATSSTASRSTPASPAEHHDMANDDIFVPSFNPIRTGIVFPMAYTIVIPVHSVHQHLQPEAAATFNTHPTEEVSTLQSRPSRKESTPAVGLKGSIWAS